MRNEKTRDKVRPTRNMFKRINGFTFRVKTQK